MIVTPVSTSQLVETVAKNEGCSVTYTPVGSIYVARTMRSLLEKGITVIFGGEGNGGLIFPKHQFCRDGGMTAAIMVSILSSEKIPLSLLVKELPEHHMIKEKIYSQDGERVLEFLDPPFLETFWIRRMDRKFSVRIVGRSSGHPGPNHLFV